jgi:3-deoxy-D-manno-octulosonic acid (KDO) 8-phosphate synthase
MAANVVAMDITVSQILRDVLKISAFLCRQGYGPWLTGAARA